VTKVWLWLLGFWIIVLVAVAIFTRRRKPPYEGEGE